MRFIFALLLTLITSQAFAAASLVSAFGTVSSASGGTANAGKTGTNTIQFIGATVGKVGGKPTVVIDANGQTITPSDVVTKAPLADLRAFMTPLQLAAWTVDKTTDVTSAFVAAIAAVPTGGGGIFGLTNDTYTISPITISGKKITFKPLGGTPSSTGAQTIFTGMPILKLAPGSSGDAFTVTGSGAALELRDIGLNGNTAFQTYSSHGVHTISGGTAVVDHSTIWNFKADGVHADASTPNLIVTNRSYVVSNGRYGVYLYKLYDAVVEDSYIGDNGADAANIYIDGDSGQASEHIRIRQNDIYWSADHAGSTGNNVYVGPWARSVYLDDNDYYRAPKYGVYVKESSLTNAYVSIIGGRFQKNSSSATGTYSDVYAGHTGVSLLGTTHQYPGSGTQPKYLVEISNSISTGSISALGLMYDSSAYTTSAINYRTHAHWITRGSNYFARDAFLQFNQSATSTSLMESYGAGGGTQFTLQAIGKFLWGDGTNSPDTTLYRLGTNLLGTGSVRTDNSSTFQSASPNATVTYFWGDDNGRLRTRTGGEPSNHNTSGIPFARSGYNGLGSASGTQNLSVAYSVVTITPNGATTFNITGGGAAGDYLTFVITTSGTTSYNITFGTNMYSAGVLATGAVSNKKYTVRFVCTDGTNWVEDGKRSDAM